MCNQSEHRFASQGFNPQGIRVHLYSPKNSSVSHFGGYTGYLTYEREREREREREGEGERERERERVKAPSKITFNRKKKSPKPNTDRVRDHVFADTQQIQLAGRSTEIFPDSKQLFCFLCYV